MSLTQFPSIGSSQISRTSKLADPKALKGQVQFAGKAPKEEEITPSGFISLDEIFKNTFDARQAIEVSKAIPVSELYANLMKDPAPALSPHQRLWRAVVSKGTGETNVLGKKVKTYKAFARLRGLEEEHQDFMNAIRDGLDGNQKGRRAILLLGGAGSGKTETANIVKGLLAESTTTPLNPVWTLKWKNLPQDILRLNDEQGEEDRDPKLSNPLLLYPLKTRQVIQNSLNDKFAEKLGYPIYTLTEEELSGRSAKIRDLLVQRYLKELAEPEADARTIEKYSQGLAKSQPELSDEDRLKEATARFEEERLMAATQKMLQHAEAQRVEFREDVGIGYLEGKDPNHFDISVISGDVSPAGEARYGSAADPRAFDYGRSDIMKGAGGIVHFDEMLKIKDTHLNGMLQIGQEGRAKGIAGIREKILTVMLGTSNLPEYIKMRRQKSNEALFQRMVLVKFRYPRNYKHEMQAYEDFFKPQAEKANIFLAPYALQTAALFATMTRLIVPKGEKRDMLPMKADLYAGEFSKYPKVSQEEVIKWKNQGEVNYEDESKEEGFIGIGVRLMGDLLTSLKNSPFIGEEGSERTLDGFAMIEVLRDQLEKNTIFQLTSEKERSEYNALISLAQERLEELVSEDIKSVIESDEEQLQAAYHNYLSRVVAWTKHKDLSEPFVSKNEIGLPENLKAAEDAMALVETELGLRTGETRESHRYRLAGKIARMEADGKNTTLEDNPSLKKALLAILQRSMQVGIPFEALKTETPNEDQKGQQSRFYTLMSKKGYNRTAAKKALECYQRINNRQ